MRRIHGRSQYEWPILFPVRVVQPPGQRGSLKWIQAAVNSHWSQLEGPIRTHTSASEIQWLSPLADDAFAEYRDEAFLDRIGHPELMSSLREFWPARGPQWDALGRTEKGDILLVEAKAHIPELCSSATQAGAESLARIESALADLATRLDADPNRAPWTSKFYQLANRLAHLDFLRRHNVRGWLVLVNFVGDAEMNGPASAEAWIAAYHVANYAMGLGHSHLLTDFVLHVPVQID